MGGAPRGGGPGLSSLHLCPHRSVSPGPKGSRREEVEAAIRNLLLCLDPSLPGRSPADSPGPPASSHPKTSALFCPGSCRYFWGSAAGAELREASEHSDAHPMHSPTRPPPAPTASCPPLDPHQHPPRPAPPWSLSSELSLSRRIRWVLLSLRSHALFLALLLAAVAQKDPRL